MAQLKKVNELTLQVVTSKIDGLHVFVHQVGCSQLVDVYKQLRYF